MPKQKSEHLTPLRLNGNSMNHSDVTMNPQFEDENRQLRQACAEARTLLNDAADRLRAVLHDEPIILETPLEAEFAMRSAAEAIDASLRWLESVGPAKELAVAPPRGGPTRQQGQFLAFIREYKLRNHAGVAPTHAEFQRFFNLTPPSVNSMLKRLEELGFIRRVPGKARSIELTINPDWIPPLDRPFKI